SILPFLILIQCARAPRGASLRPTPSHSSGQVLGSQRELLKVETSRVFTRSVSSLLNSLSHAIVSAASMPRAAVRPSVENTAATGTFSLPSTMLTNSFTSEWPEARPTTTRASGPTSMGLSFQRGVFRNEYLSYPARVSNGGCGPVYLILVSPAQGCRPSTPPSS